MHRQVLASAAALIFVGSAASAADITSNDTGLSATGARVSAVEITQNNDLTIVDPLQIECSAGGVATVRNQFLRRFFLNTDHGIVDPFTIESVEFGVLRVEDATGGGAPVSVSVDVNIYSIPAGDTFTYANLTLEDTAFVEVATADEGTLKSVAIGGVIGNPSTTDLVMEIVAEDFSSQDVVFRVGTNDLGAIHDAYVASPTCGPAEPTAVTLLGFPDSQFIFIIRGHEDDPTPSKPATWSEVKSLF